jgi:serine phosphatase RsbU (regulator of sigma subunit)
LRGLRAKEAVAAVKEDVDAFVLDAPQFDDITIVAVRQENNAITE